jgi:hypothetical protein
MFGFDFHIFIWPDEEGNPPNNDVENPNRSEEDGDISRVFYSQSKG